MSSTWLLLWMLLLIRWSSTWKAESRSKRRRASILSSSDAGLPEEEDAEQKADHPDLEMTMLDANLPTSDGRDHDPSHNSSDASGVDVRILEEESQGAAENRGEDGHGGRGSASQEQSSVDPILREVCFTCFFPLPLPKLSRPSISSTRLPAHPTLGMDFAFAFLRFWFESGSLGLRSSVSGALGPSFSSSVC